MDPAETGEIQPDQAVEVSEPQAADADGVEAASELDDVEEAEEYWSPPPLLASAYGLTVSEPAADEPVADASTD